MARSRISSSELGARRISFKLRSGNSRPMIGVTSKDLYWSRTPFSWRGSLCVVDSGCLICMVAVWVWVAVSVDMALKGVIGLLTRLARWTPSPSRRSSLYIFPLTTHIHDELPTSPTMPSLRFTTDLTLLHGSIRARDEFTVQSIPLFPLVAAATFIRRVPQSCKVRGWMGSRNVGERWRASSAKTIIRDSECRQASSRPSLSTITTEITNLQLHHEYGAS